MPFYNVTCRNSLTSQQRIAIAQGITDTHCAQTGALAEFVNVVFMDGYPLPNGEIANISGAVRIGGNRTDDDIRRLEAALQETVAAKLKQPKRRVGISTIGMPASWVVEGGRVMPEPGQEQEWIAASLNVE